VDLVPDEVPAFFRSGMNATVDFKAEARENALLIPVGAVQKENNESYVILKEEGAANPAKRIIKTGITDDKNYEVISGITADDAVVITTKEYSLPTSGNTGSNPFLPKMPSHNKNKSAQSQK
jgi:multidrug efflux pump subunit AcrA (membrane-fusion protein)